MSNVQAVVTVSPVIVILIINAIALLVYIAKGDTYEVPPSKKTASQDTELDQQ
jgi:hypothetical protein